MNPGLLGLVGAPTYRMLHDTTQREFFDVLRSNNIPHKWRASDKELILTGLESHIIFRSLDEPTRLVGTNLAWFAMDELSYCSEDSFLRLQARLREPRAVELTGIAGCTPNGLNWVYDRFFGEKNTPEYVAVKAVPGENHHLSPGFYENLQHSYDERFYRQEVLGEYLPLQAGTTYYAFDRIRNVDQKIRYDASCRLTWTLDFNIDPMCSLIGQLRTRQIPMEDKNGEHYFKRHKTLEVLDEISIRDANVDLVCKTFLDRTQRYLKTDQRLKVDVYGDASGNSRNHAGKSDWQMVREFFARHPEYDPNWRIPVANNPIRDRVNAVNGALFNAMHQVHVTLHPRCKVLVRDLERVTWKKDSHGNLVGGLNQTPELTHMSDAFGYMVEQEFPLASKVRVTVF